MVRLICDLVSVKTSPQGMTGPTGATYHFDRDSGEAEVHEIDAERFLKFQGFRRAGDPPPPPPVPAATKSELPPGGQGFDPDATPEERLATRRAELEVATKDQLMLLAEQELRVELSPKVKKAVMIEAILDAEFPGVDDPATPAD